MNITTTTCSHKTLADNLPPTFSQKGLDSRNLSLKNSTSWQQGDRCCCGCSQFLSQTRMQYWTDAGTEFAQWQEAAWWGRVETLKFTHGYLVCKRARQFVRQLTETWTQYNGPSSCNRPCFGCLSGPPQIHTQDLSLRCALTESRISAAHPGWRNPDSAVYASSAFPCSPIARMFGLRAFPAVYSVCRDMLRLWRALGA